MTDMTDSAVSVVIATHRVQDFSWLIDAVESVRKQTVPVAAIVVAVDHNPELADRVTAVLEHVVVVRNDGSVRGASATRNLGAAATSTPTIAFLDDDEVAESEWLERLLPPLARPDVVGTGGRYVPRWIAGRPAWFPDELAWAVGAHHSGMSDTAGPVRNVWSGNMAVRAELFRSVGGFREGFGKSGTRLSPEDTDLCVRMAATTPDGHWIYQPDARIAHAVPAERSTFAFYVRRCFAEGRGKIYLRELNPEGGVLETERRYLTRTIPRGIARHLRHPVRGLRPALAIVVGIVASAVGAVVSTVEGRRGRRPLQ